jgi:hypothetical protein
MLDRLPSINAAPLAAECQTISPRPTPTHPQDPAVHSQQQKLKKHSSTPLQQGPHLMQVLKLVNLVVYVCSTLAQLNRFVAQALAMAVICEKAVTCTTKMIWRLEAT